MAMDAEERKKAITTRIRGNFDRSAADYSRFEDASSFFDRLTCSLLDVAGFTSSALPDRVLHVLDVGCGTGASLAAMARVLGDKARLVGLDLSMEMLKSARRKLGDEPGLVGLVQADGAQLDGCFAPGFDLVAYNASLFLIPDGKGSLAAASRLLRPGGAVLVSALDRVEIVSDGGHGEVRTGLRERLTAKGHPVGGHALTPWEQAKSALDELFTELRHETLCRKMSKDEFLGFYTVESMSAGLMPRLAFAERQTILTGLADEIYPESAVFQHWKLAAGAKAV